MILNIFLYVALLASGALNTSCQQSTPNFISGSKNTQNKPSTQGDGKRPSEEGEGLIGYLRSPDAVKTTTNGVQREFFGEAGAIVATRGTPEGLDVCALQLTDNLESTVSLPQHQIVLATTKATKDGSFRLSLLETTALSVRHIGLDVSGRCLSKDFRPETVSNPTFVVGSLESGWKFNEPKSFRNALTGKKESSSEVLPSPDSLDAGTSSPISSNADSPIEITNSGGYICDLNELNQCPLTFRVGADSWRKRDFSVYPSLVAQRFFASLYQADQCRPSEVNRVVFYPKASPVAFPTPTCAVPLGASFQFWETASFSLALGNYLLVLTGEDRIATVLLTPNLTSSLILIETD